MFGGATAFWRGRAEATLTDTATWSRITVTDDPDTGNPVETETDMGEIPCRFAATLQPEETIIGGAVIARYRWLVYLAADVAITRLDRLTKGGEVFAVVDTDARRTGPLLQAVTCVRHM